jgi:hypothetical protein
MENRFLPLGSVVLLKDAQRPIVIIGYTVVEEGSTDIWDYLGCAYPIGVIDPSKNLLFQRNQIAQVLHTGYTDDDGNKFLDQLTDNVSKIKPKA